MQSPGRTAGWKDFCPPPIRFRNARNFFCQKACFPKEKFTGIIKSLLMARITLIKWIWMNPLTQDSRCIIRKEKL